MEFSKTVPSSPVILRNSELITIFFPFVRKADFPLGAFTLKVFAKHSKLLFSGRNVESLNYKFNNHTDLC